MDKSLFVIDLSQALVAGQHVPIRANVHATQILLK